MKRYWITASCLALAGCMASNGLQYEAVAETNQYHIAKVHKGMSEKQVLRIMHKPYSYESFQVCDDIYDVWFYVTRPTGLDQTRMVPQNLTPLTFKNGVLVGTGYSWYYYAMKEQAAEVAAQNPQSPRKTQDQEDLEFEQALRNYPPPSSQPAPAQPTTPPASPSASAPPRSSSPTDVFHAEGPNLSKPTRSFLKPYKPPVVGVIQRKQLAQVSKGMTEAEVTDTLGVPMRTETFEIGQDVYDVWFYETPAKKKQPAQQVPLTFKNGVLVGMTQDEYNRIKQSADESQINGYDESAEDLQQQESEQNFNYW